MEGIVQSSIVADEDSARSPSHLVPTTSTTVNTQNSKSRACVACREKHLKCDGLKRCTRCAAQSTTCVYLKSRRGYRGRDVHDKHASKQISHNIETSVSESTATNSSNTVFISPAEGAVSLPLAFPSVPNEADSNGLYSRMFRPNYLQRCLDAFYQYFYDAHPFMPPRHQIIQVFKTRPMEHLQMAMCYVGSRYVPGSSTAAYGLEIESYLSGTKPAPKDASTVQAMLIFALGLDGNNERAKAIEVLIKAQNLAIELGMNQREYAVVNGQGSPTCEESLRRTWWELYVVSVMLAGFHGGGTFHQRDTLHNVPLPCEERDFASGYIPQLHTIEEFDDECFDRNDIAFSSYAHRIAAIRNLDKILQSKEILFPDDPTLHRLEAHLTNWHLHLPDSKRDLFDQFGTFDEMLFQAHMIANVSTMLLYRNFSPLDALALRTITTCTGEPGASVRGISDTTHTRRTIQAASKISKLVTLPGPLVKHTHFFVCALGLSSITHLSRWAILPAMTPDQDLRQQIRMNAGALKALAPFWPSAELGFRQVTNVAQKIYAKRKDAVGEAFWRDFIEDDFMGGLIEGTVSIQS